MNDYLFLILIFLVTILIYQKIYLPLNYWRSRKVFQVYPLFRFLKVLLCLSNESLLDVYRSIALENKNRRYFGTFLSLQPALVVNDLDLIKQTMSKDFAFFHDRVDFINNANDQLLNSNLVSLTGKKWREMRSVLSPAFTTNKMKAMYPLISDTAKLFSNHLEENVGANGNRVVEVNSKELFQKYTNDVIVNCCFGINVNSLHENEENCFLQAAKMFAKPQLWSQVKGICFLLVPKLFKVCYMRVEIAILPVEISKVFIDTIINAIVQREKLKIYRPDLIHLLIEAKKGQLKDDTNENVQEPGFAAVEEHKLTNNNNKMKKELVFTNELVAGQTSIILAGSAASSTFLQFFSYELALHPEVQQKLQQEIDVEMSKSANKEIPYDSLIKMKYLDQTVCEVLRRWPAAYVLSRLCTKDYVIEPVHPGEERLVVEKGSMVLLPVIGLHFDPDLFADPEKFDPEHFTDENKAKSIKGAFLPFGQGPRNCMGSRFGLLLIKAQVVNLLYKFDVVSTQKTRIQVVNSLMTECKAVWLGLRKRS